MKDGNGIIKIQLGEERYPRLLSEISGPPKQLYCRGNLSLLNSFCFGVVGTRKITGYGKEILENMLPTLVRYNFTIVSGLAIGIDAVAHSTTLASGGKTIAVLGGGISDKNIGPRTNLPLAQDILRNDGLLMSEYSDEEIIFPTNFAARDRIISGLSKGLLVVEADRESGSLITAKFALEQNRDVFAVPGNIFSPKSTGTNRLIQSGAKLVMSAQDIMEDYGYNLSLFDKENFTISTKDPIENAIIGILSDRGSLSADEIIRESGKETPQVMAAISILEIDGLIKNIGSGKYKLNSKV